MALVGFYRFSGFDGEVCSRAHFMFSLRKMIISYLPRRVGDFLTAGCLPEAYSPFPSLFTVWRFR